MRGFQTGRRLQRAIAIAAAAGMGCLLIGCPNRPVETRAPTDAFGQLERTTFNARAAEAARPWFWIKDTNANGQLEARELAIVWTPEAPRSQIWIHDGKFTPQFEEDYAQLASALSPPTDERGRRVLEELRVGTPALVFTDFSTASPEDWTLVQKVSELARAVERVHMRQLGSAQYFERLPDLDPASRALFLRNHGPWCVASAAPGEATCGALAEMPAPASGLYPADLQQEQDFCRKLAAHADASRLLDRFHAVRRQGDKLVAVPYSEAFKPETTAVAHQLEALAEVIRNPRDEALRAYVLAAAEAFKTNDWNKADAAWIEMLDASPRWYLRVAPDESYFAPCGRKAMFELSLGLVDRRSRTWKKKLAIVRSKMERQLAQLAGPPYRERPVEFALPDFVSVVLNAADARVFSGAYVGQSLPLTGPLVAAGRQRTVAFSNLYDDHDSRALFGRTVQDYFCEDSIAYFSSDSRARIINTVLHDASRNLGPTSEYRVEGRTPPEIFGGLTATMMEELKAQSAAMYFIEWLRAKELIEPSEAREALAFTLVWSFTHISRGVFTQDGRRQLMGHVGAILLGFLMQGDAVVWLDDMPTAAGNDRGCFSLRFHRYSEAAKAMAKTIAEIKAQGDQAGAETVKKRFVDNGPRNLFKIIQERGRRQSRATFGYGFRGPVRSGDPK